MICFQNVNAAYGKKPILEDVSFIVPAHETMVLLGGSGAGKSTILKTLLRLIPIAQGNIFLDGQNIHETDRLILRRQIGTVFQGNALFPHLTVSENIALPLRVAGLKKQESLARVDEMQTLVGLDPAIFSMRYPHQLSGGQQQRVGVARALVTRPGCLLMDEPFSALDAINRRNLQEELKLLRSRLGISILFVTHDVMEAASLGDSIAVMDQGKILQIGTTRDLLEHPQHEVVQALVSKPLSELRNFVKDNV